MPSIIELQSFYKHIPNQDMAPIKNEIGHFNIFKVEDMLIQNHKPVNYSRRNFFKVSLVTGQSKIHYADQRFDVTDSVLVFTNPMVPYFWEIISEKQTGFICIFTEAFFNRFGNIKDYPVFQSAGAAVIPLAANDALRYADLFSKMYAELQSDYVYKYDLLRNLLMALIHEAQKMQPEIMKTTVLFNYLYIVSPVVEDNSIKNRQQKDLGAIPFKTYRVYQKTPS